MSNPSATRLWRAVVSRDRSADGLFVYAVASTRVYCRPSCPSRRPRPDRVTFFATPSAARDAGYRPCRRCEPDTPRPSQEDSLVARACRAIAAQPERAWSTARVARASGGSVSQLQRAFRVRLGLAPRDYVAVCRRHTLLTHLREGASVTRAVYDAGYGSTSRIYEPAVLPGMTPATYGRGGAGASIEWATAASPLGRILVASTPHGVCFVEIGATDEELLAELTREFPRASVAARPSARLRPLTALARAVAGGQPWSAEVPFDIQGTAFQWRVWRALTAIPPGETRTYTDVARAIGSPASVRAVARACATNPVSLFIPCHRVVGMKGDLRGYRWGTHVKSALIARERRRTPAGV